MKRDIKVWDYAGRINEETGKGVLLTTKSGDKVSKYFGISKYTLYSYIDASKNL